MLFVVSVNVVLFAIAGAAVHVTTPFDSVIVEAKAPGAKASSAKAVVATTLSLSRLIKGVPPENRPLGRSPDPCRLKSKKHADRAVPRSVKPNLNELTPACQSPDGAKITS